MADESSAMLVVEANWRGPRGAYKLCGETVIGTPDDDIEIDVRASIAIVRWREGAWRVGPRNSSVRLNGAPLTVETVLRHGDSISETGIRLRFLLGDHARVLEEERHVATGVDPLTQLLNRRFLARYLVRQTAPTAVLMIDIDGMKRINDTYGFFGGDTTLQVTAARIRGEVAWPGCVVRFGGEEFVVVVPGVTHAEALVHAERIRAACELTFPFEDVQLTATVSIGVVPLLADSMETVRQAEEAMLQAKEQGRNRVVG